jgi:hypothetical protein
LIDLSVVFTLVGFTFVGGWIMGFVTGRWTQPPPPRRDPRTKG